MKLSRVLLSCAFVSSLARILAACSDDARTAASGAPDAADSASPPDAEASDAGLDTDAKVEAAVPDLSDEPVVCAVDPCVTRIAAGQSHFCALLADKTVRCWGDDTLGSLGAVDAGGAGMPSAVASLTNVNAISAAGRTTCALLEGGEVRCWGDNTKGQLGAPGDAGLSDNQPHPIPVRVALPSAAKRVDVGHGTSCAVLTSGAVTCWGANGTKQLGRTDAGAVGAPVEITLAEADAAIVRTGSNARSGHALTDDARLFSWGAVSGRLGSIDPDPEPAPLPTLANVSGFGAGPDHVCAIVNGGEVRCWENMPYPTHFAPLCTGANERPSLPIPAPLPKNAKGAAQQVSLSMTTTCVRLTDGTVYCCGDDTFGQLGQAGDGGKSLGFVRAAESSDRAVQVATADQTTCILLANGSVSCWGSNAHGELGQGDHDDARHATPVVVQF